MCLYLNWSKDEAMFVQGRNLRRVCFNMSGRLRNFAEIARGSRVGEGMGKVHGSLARAGKVKNQTPKVFA